MDRESHDYETIRGPIDENTCSNCILKIGGLSFIVGKPPFEDCENPDGCRCYLYSPAETIANHYQQASLHLEAAAGHLQTLLAMNQQYLDSNGRILFPWLAREFAQVAEQRAQAALSGETIHAPE